MGNLINCYVIYNGTTGSFVGEQARPTISINCERIEAWSPRPVWLKRFTAPGDGTVILYEPTFNPTSDELLDPNTLQGYWVEQDGQDAMVDVASLAAFQTACNAAAGSVGTLVTPFYVSGLTAFTTLTLNTVCIYRFDSGSQGAIDKFAWDYASQYLTVVARSNFSNVSHYTLTTYWTVTNFPLIGTDTIYTGTCSS